MSPTLNEVEMPELLWYTVEEYIQRLREMGMLKLTCHIRSAHPHDQGARGHTMTIKNKFVKGASASLKSSVVALLCRSEIIGRMATTDWDP